MERAQLTAHAIAAATSGGDAAKTFTQILGGYAPADVREAAEARQVSEGLNKLQKLFGG